MIRQKRQYHRKPPALPEQNPGLLEQPSILSMLADAGLKASLRLDARHSILVSPKSLLTDDLAALIVTNRPAILTHLVGQQNAGLLLRPYDINDINDLYDLLPG